jgi:hypothetical protein
LGYTYRGEHKDAATGIALAVDLEGRASRNAMNGTSPYGVFLIDSLDPVPHLQRRIAVEDEAKPIFTTTLGILNIFTGRKLSIAFR